MYKNIKNIIIAILNLDLLTGCSEECDSKQFSSYCDGNTIVYCAYDGGIENADTQTVIYENCSELNSSTPFCVEVKKEKDPQSRASCVISKSKDPNCSSEELSKFYCKDTARHKCYYEYTVHISNKGVCSE